MPGIQQPQREAAELAFYGLRDERDFFHHKSCSSQQRYSPFCPKKKKAPDTEALSVK
jgi:hypothetical protein